MSAVSEMKKDVLCVGLCCLDIISYCQHYPQEDTDSRCLDQRWCLGGNACNNARVLGLLGTSAKLYAAIPSDLGKVPNQVLHSLLNKQAIDTKSRLRASVQSAIKITDYSWVHFEGRNFDEVRRMLDWSVQQRGTQSHPFISVECEKVRPEPLLEQLIPGVNVLFVSKDFARKHGYEDMTSAVKGIHERWADADTTVICAWGSIGAAAYNQSVTYTTQAYMPDGQFAVDTLGAGDTFVASCIHAMHSLHYNIQQSIEFACKVAGTKCTQRGFDHLAQFK